MTASLMLRCACTTLVTIAISACASNDNPPCRRVSAQDFIRPHTFKGIATDQFIGVTASPAHFPPMKGETKAFKTIWELGLFNGWAVIWCPADELPRDYLRTAHTKPNRRTVNDGFSHD